MVGNVFVNILYISENASHFDVLICVSFDSFYNFKRVKEEVIKTHIGEVKYILN